VTTFGAAGLRTLLGIYSITLVAVMGVSSLGPALPAMRDALGLSAPQVALVVSAFTVPSVVLSLFVGALSDRIGRKRVLVPALLLFGAASAGCALTDDFTWLVAFRLLQGIGASAFAILNLSLIGDLFSGEARVRALGFNSSVLAIGMGVFPLLGGLLASISWQTPFWLGISALPVAAWVFFRLRVPPQGEQTALGAYLRAAASHLADARVLLLIVMGALTFVMHYGAYVTYLPLFLHARLGLESAAIGVIMGGSALGSALASTLVGAVGTRVSERHWLFLSCALYGLSLSLVPSALSFTLAALISGVFGVAHGLCIPSQHRVWAALAPEAQRGAFMSLNGTSFRLGQTIGPFAVGLWATSYGYDQAFRAAALVAVALFASAALLFRLGVR